jgi:two-component system, NarL family, response regulator, fimbrial Z protein, FimZ
MLARGTLPAHAQAHALVVEDHDEMRAALRDWLSRLLAPLRLREARDMAEALARAGEAPLDFALVNVELPGPNGIETTRELRRRYPSCPVIVMSVQDSEALRLAAIDAGADAFVCKRELTSRLLPILSRVCSCAAARRTATGESAEFDIPRPAAAKTIAPCDATGCSSSTTSPPSASC